MLTIKVKLAESGAVATIDKNFPLYQGQYQNVLLNAYVPLSLLAPNFKVYAPQQAGVVSPYVAGSTVKVASRSLSRSGNVRLSKNYYLRFVKTLVDNGTEYALFERKLPKEFTTYHGIGGSATQMILNVENIEYGEVSTVSVKDSAFAVSGTSVAITNSAKFISAINEQEGEYTFTYYRIDGVGSWYLNNNEATLSTFGLTVTGTQSNADTFTIKAVSTETKITRLSTSQTVALDVLPSASLLDNDETIQPTQAEEIESEITAIKSVLPTKQNIHDNDLTTSDKTIVGAINELDGELEGVTTIVEDHDQRIDTLETEVAENTSDIADLKTIVGSGENYIGTWNYASATPPTANQVSTWVQQQVGRPPKGSDVVIVSLIIEGATDKSYKYYFNGTTWLSYEIPPIESAKNGTKGLVQGSYGVSNYNVLVDIDNGEIKHIYVKDVAQTNQYISLETIIGSIKTKNATQDDAINGIINGTTVVGKSLRAVSDELGNDIVATYMTKQNGATKEYVKDYALPKEFNNTFYLTANGYQEAQPTDGFSATVSTSGIGDFKLVDHATYTVGDLQFQLSSKNAFKANFFVKASTSVASTRFRLEIFYKHGNEAEVQIGSALSSIGTVTTSYKNAEFESVFSLLGQNVLEVTTGDQIFFDLYAVRQTSPTASFTVVSNVVNASKFYLSTNISTIVTATVLQTTGTSTSDTMSQNAITRFGTKSLVTENLITNVTYDTTDGMRIYASATETNGLGNKTYSKQTTIPIIAGDNVTIDADEENEHIVINASGGNYYIDWSKFEDPDKLSDEIANAALTKKDDTTRVTVVFYGEIPTALAQYMSDVVFLSDMNYVNTSRYAGYDGGSHGGFVLGGLENVRFENFTFSYGQAGDNPTLIVDNCENIEFINCAIYNKIIYPLYITGSSHIYFENCQIKGSSMPITGHNASTEISGASSGWVMFENCVFDNVRGYAIQTDVQNTDYTITCNSCLIDSTTNPPVELTNIKNTGTAKVLVSTVNIPSPTTATQGQFLVADGQGGASWTTVPSAETQNV